MAEVMAEIENRDVDELVILPPPPDPLTDNEEGDENEILSPVDFADVPGEIEIVDLDDDEETDGALPGPSVEPATSWRSCNKPRYTLPPFKGVPEERWATLQNEMAGLSPLQTFNLMWEGCDDLILNETLRYAHEQGGDHGFSMSTADAQRFNGILLLSGYHTVPTIRHYWNVDPDLGCYAVQQSMTRDRFLKVKQHLHLVDNSSLPPGATDRLFKVHRLHGLLENCAPNEHRVYFDNYFCSVCSASRFEQLELSETIDSIMSSNFLLLPK